VSVLGAALLKFNVNFIVGASALFFENNSGMIVLKIALMRSLGGLVLPLSLLPVAIREMTLWTPFPYMYYVPVQVYLGVLPASELGRLLGYQWLWVTLLWGAGMLMEWQARRLVHSQGG